VVGPAGRLFTAAKRAREFDAELESHLEMHIEENLRRGMRPGEARRQALIALGGPQVVRDTYRDRGTIPLIESLAHDLRLALRLTTRHDSNQRCASSGGGSARVRWSTSNA
jgi:hypothetical protein